MRDHYRQFSHPVLDFEPDKTKSLFEEFDTVAEECRAHALFVEDDLQIAFPQLCRLRGLELKHGWLWLFEIWRDHDRGQQVIDAAERPARLAQLCKQREELFAERAVAPPQQHAALTARLAAIGRELADIMTPPPSASLASWGASWVG